MWLECSFLGTEVEVDSAVKLVPGVGILVMGVQCY